MYYTALLESVWRFSQRVFVWLQIPVTLLDTLAGRGSERETKKREGGGYRREKEREKKGKAKGKRGDREREKRRGGVIGKLE